MAFYFGYSNFGHLHILYGHITKTPFRITNKKYRILNSNPNNCKKPAQINHCSHSSYHCTYETIPSLILSHTSETTTPLKIRTNIHIQHTYTDTIQQSNSFGANTAYFDWYLMKNMNKIGTIKWKKKGEF